MNSKLKRLLEEVLGHSKKTDSKDNSTFDCPIPTCNHVKQKLEINLDETSSGYQKFHCWVCNLHGGNLANLFKTAGASPEQLQKLFKITGKKSQATTEDLTAINFGSNKIEETSSIFLPYNFNPLYIKHKTITYKNMMNFAKKRGLTKTDILRYNIGYCEEGQYKGRLIIPSYDSIGGLNYFTGRDIYANSILKYKNPSVSRNVIVFEAFINWDMPVNICEGMFDAIAIRVNAIPNMGKTFSPKLLEKIRQHKPHVNIILDNDAQNDAYTMGTQLSADGISVNIVELPKNEDPSSLGFKKIWGLINNSKPKNDADLYKEQILNKLF